MWMAPLAVLLVASLMPTDAEARPGRVSQTPNGAMFSCGLCHADGGAGPRNAFGQDVQANLTEPGAAGQVQWDLIFSLDSDGDGCTNGQELGDPDGAWTIGDPDPDGTVSNPSDPGSSQEGCGDDPVNNDPDPVNNDPGNNDPDPVNNDPGNNDPDPVNNDPGNNDPDPVNNDDNNDVNNDVNNDGNNDANNDPGDGGENGNDDDGGDDGCSTAPGQPSNVLGVMLMALGAFFLRRRRS